MGMTLEDLIIFCKNQEQYHNTLCQRYDDASGYSRSKNLDVRTINAKLQEKYSCYYQQIADIILKYQEVEQIMHKVYASDNADACLVQRLAEIRKVMEDGNDT